MLHLIQKCYLPSAREDRFCRGKLEISARLELSSEMEFAAGGKRSGINGASTRSCTQSRTNRGRATEISEKNAHCRCSVPAEETHGKREGGGIGFAAGKDLSRDDRLRSVPTGKAFSLSKTSHVKVKGRSPSRRRRLCNSEWRINSLRWAELNETGR